MMQSNNEDTEITVEIPESMDADGSEDVEDLPSDGATLDEIPKDQRNLRTQAYDKSISDVIRMIDVGDICLDPDYQRTYIWDTKTASRLIESILLNVPIPIIYVAEDEDNRWDVVDGLQRLNSLKRFFANEFKIRGLEVLRDLNGVQYSTLDPKSARLLRNGILRFILIFKESHPDIKYDIFMRLNRGSVKLSDQELRNCLFRGTLNDLLHELRKNRKLMTMLGLANNPHRRMEDAELILRYFTISDSYDPEHKTLVNYVGKVKSSLNKYYAAKRNSPPNEIKRLRSKFEVTVDKVYAVFGNDAFQRINADGTFEGRLSRGIMDIEMVSFEHASLEDLVSHKTGIYQLLRDLPQNDPRFNEAITIGTSDKKQLEYRLATWHSELDKLLQ